MTVLLLASACEWLEMVESEYPDIQAAIEDGAIERGWIPGFLPASTKDIKEKHNLDTNEIWLKFSIDANDQGFIEEVCQQIENQEVLLPRKKGGKWWPEMLVEKRRNAQEKTNEYTFFRCQNGGSIAFSTIEEGKYWVYYWYIRQGSS